MSHIFGCYLLLQTVAHGPLRFWTHTSHVLIDTSLSTQITEKTKWKWSQLWC